MPSGGRIECNVVWVVLIVGGVEGCCVLYVGDVDEILFWTCGKREVSMMTRCMISTRSSADYVDVQRSVQPSSSIIKPSKKI